ncbi:berberine bridge enzyme-like 21 [Malania oleifera]|uniref:berberine bridge enzyme-like 21 n=1 Tax=Malania oleifera TaxID=397392 RepID=UPI0025AE7692|nr:berberine bridge enzyme-like 21 [Malania oleifera]
MHIFRAQTRMKIPCSANLPAHSLLLLLPFLLLPCALCAVPSVYDNFLQCLSKNSSDPSNNISSIVYSNTNPAYTKVLQAYIRNSRFDTPTTPKPVLIVTPQQESQVQAAVLCAKTIGIQIKIRSCGHDYDGISYVSEVPFIILDMFNLRKITVNIKAGTAWAQAGATIGELYHAIAQSSKVHAFPAGICPSMCVGGHISGGGYGNLLRKYGLSVDNLLDAQIVDVSGKLLDRRGMGEDLFWAISGGGGASFGVITSYFLKLVLVPQIVTYFRVERTLEQNATDVVFQWLNVADKIDNDLFMRLLVQPTTKKGQTTIRVSVIGEFLGDSQRLLGVVGKDFPALGLTQTDCKQMSWIESVLYWANFDNGSTPVDVLLNRIPDSISFLKRKSDYLQTPIPRAGLEALWKKMIELGEIGLVFNAYGGRMSEIPATATPFPHRAGNICKIQHSVTWDEAGNAAANKNLEGIRSLYEFMTSFVSKNPRGAFLNYRDLDIGVNHHGNTSYAEGTVYGKKYFMGNFDRLVKVKTAVDPTNFFWNEQSVPIMAEA